MQSPRSRIHVGLLASAALALAGCGALVDQLAAEDVAIAVLLKTPEQTKPNSTETIPAHVEFQLFFGHLDKSKIVRTATGAEEATEGAFQPNVDAQVTLEFTDPVKGATTINVGKGATDGIYSSNNSLDGRLAYVEGDYLLSISYGGKIYRMKVTAGTPTTIEEFEGREGRLVTDWDTTDPKNAAGFTVTRKDASVDPKDNALAFVNLEPVTDPSGTKYTNMPADPLGFLKLVLNDTEWRAKSFTIPLSHLKPQNAYVVALTSFAKGSQDPTGAPLFVGSTFLAGIADGGGI